MSQPFGLDTSTYFRVEVGLCVMTSHVVGVMTGGGVELVGMTVLTTSSTLALRASSSLFKLRSQLLYTVCAGSNNRAWSLLTQI